MPRPYHVECTGSRPITEVKQNWAWLVLGWETAWEHQVCRLLFKAKVFLLLLYAKSYCCLKFGDVKKLSLIERGAKIFNGSNFGQNNRKPKNLFCSINFVYNQLLIGQK